MFRFLLTVPLVLLSKTSNGQDTSTYCQMNSMLFSNCYIFIRKDSLDKLGEFTQKILTDDLQSWYGTGSFKETRRKIKLTFSGKLPDMARTSLGTDKVFGITHLLNTKKATLRKARGAYVAKGAWVRGRRVVFTRRD